MILNVRPGESFPLGATVQDEGINFCIYSPDATTVTLLLFDEPETPYPRSAIQLHPKHNRTFHYWHVFVEGLSAGQVYGYRVDGPYDPTQGLWFNPNKVLLDPYARSVVGWSHYSRSAAIAPLDNCAQSLRAVVVDPDDYDWEGDRHPRISYAETVIYELHVSGFTQHPNSGIAAHQRGTYAGLIQKIPYLQSLGITAVELMPIQQFDPNDAPPGVVNYWGYSPIAFFAPHQGYSSRPDRFGPVDEFRDLVKALHRAGIEVILDVVFNHTAEGDHTGPTLSFRGLSNEAYYILESNKAYYKNYSGCGNTVKTSAISSYLIIDCLRYWVSEMHVDGFRFDLASVLSRGLTGEPLDDPSILWMINTDPVLAGSKIIAEAWDAAGLYQVGRFAGERFAEWNGPYRDEVRRFVRGDNGVVQSLAARIIGSPDIYLQQQQRGPNYSIHFIACHDGFTLYDLVSYNTKHNQANGENNRDGADANWSWNCGIEGPTDDPMVQGLRLQQAKNLMTIWAISQGTPMLLMGDEVLRSQQGNNNAYCQNNALSWFDWNALSSQRDFLRFIKMLIALIQKLHLFRHDHQLRVSIQPHHIQPTHIPPSHIQPTYSSSIHTPSAQTLPIQEPSITWHGVKLNQPDWSEVSHSLAFTLRYPQHGEQLHVMLNAYHEALSFELPSGQWQRLVDTALPSPDDICPLDSALRLNQTSYSVKARSSVILIDTVS